MSCKSFLYCSFFLVAFVFILFGVGIKTSYANTIIKATHITAVETSPNFFCLPQNIAQSIWTNPQDHNTYLTGGSTNGFWNMATTTITTDYLNSLIHGGGAGGSGFSGSYDTGAISRLGYDTFTCEGGYQLREIKIDIPNNMTIGQQILAWCITPTLSDYEHLECFYSLFDVTTEQIIQNTKGIFDTRINSFTFSTSTNTARVQGFMNATTTTGITERLQFHQFSTLLGIESTKEFIATTTGNFDLTFPFLSLPTPATSTTTPPFFADTTLFAEIYQFDNNYATDPFTGVFDSRYKTLLVATTTTFQNLTGLYLASTTAIFAYPEYECGITSLTGCFKNALIWAFYPTQSGIEQYYSFISLIESKAPIGYFFVARDAIQGLNKDGTPTTNITIPYSLKHYIFSPFDLGISGILWFFFLFNFYKRLKHITI